MSHFALHIFTAAEPDEQYLGEILAPYDESLEVEPYVGEVITDQEARELRDEHHPGKTIEAAMNDNFSGRARRNMAKGSWEILSTRNPASKWDWWSIGGRWDNSLHVGDDIWVSHAPITDLDWTELIAAATAQAHANYDLFEQATAGLAIPPSTREGASREELENDLWVLAAGASVSNDSLLRPWPHYEFHVAADDPRGEYVAENAAPDVPFAWIDVSGDWHEHATMGWFGTTINERSHRAHVDEYRAYRDGLPTGAHVTVIDCHI